MTEGFQHAIAGGQGKLIVAQLQSPNFELVPFTGWAILKTGAAYFADVTAEGNITADGVIVGTAPNSQVIITAPGNAGEIELPTNDTTEADPSIILSEVIGSGSGKYLQVVLGGPVSTGAADQALLFLTSNDEAGSSSPFGTMVYKDTSGTLHTVAYWDSAGLHVIETLYGSSGTVTIGDAVQVDNNLTVTGNGVIDGTLSVNGSTDTDSAGLPNGDISGTSATAGLPNGGIQGTSGAASAGTAHTHGPGSYSVTNGQHDHGAGSYAVTDGVHSHAL
jgi:hypothetical protein